MVFPPPPPAYISVEPVPRATGICFFNWHEIRRVERRIAVGVRRARIALPRVTSAAVAVLVPLCCVLERPALLAGALAAEHAEGARRSAAGRRPRHQRRLPAR